METWTNPATGETAPKWKMEFLSLRRSFDMLRQSSGGVNVEVMLGEGKCHAENFADAVFPTAKADRTALDDEERGAGYMWSSLGLSDPEEDDFRFSAELEATFRVQRGGQLFLRGCWAGIPLSALDGTPHMEAVRRIRPLLRSASMVVADLPVAVQIAFLGADAGCAFLGSSDGAPTPFYLYGLMQMAERRLSNMLFAKWHMIAEGPLGVLEVPLPLNPTLRNIAENRCGKPVMFQPWRYMILPDLLAACVDAADVMLSLPDDPVDALPPLTETDLRMLAKIGDAPGIKRQELFDVLGADGGSHAQRVAKLVKAGFARSNCPGYRLTDEGEATLQRNGWAVT